ncbi:hypothetical protein [Pseudomonas sp. UBA6310]|uniref:hypothetical protein n=1 Tax=Pseudomonas sp. UBA6310 TaxID=1947327 RepID=UPI00257EE10D|nr:hypothetical protein [Pseudomonas sp. UBA6310]
MSQTDRPSQSSIDRTPPNLPKQDQAGKPVDVVRKDITRDNEATETVAKVITPTTIKTKEQEADEINAGADRVERLLKR